MKSVLLSCVPIFYFVFNCIFAGSLGGPGTTPPYYAFQPFNNVFYNRQSAKGIVRMDNGFTLTVVKLGAESKIGSSIILDTCISVSGAIDLRNTNTIILLADLKLDNGATFSSGGRIYGYDRAVILGGDLTIPAGKIIHIGGRIAIDGHGNKLILGKSAELFVDAGSTLTLKNLVLQNTQNNPGNPPILCSTGGTAAYCSNLCLDNVELALADNFYFNRGQMFIHNDVAVTGTSAFVYRSCQPSFITSGAQLYFDAGTTFSVAPATFTDCPYATFPTTTTNNFIKMADQSSILNFNGCSFLTTQTGCRFTQGTVLFDNHVVIKSNITNDLAATPAVLIGSATTGNSPESVAWSPDGRFVAVVNSGSSGSNGLEIFSITSSGVPSTNPVVTATTGEYPQSVSWSPDGRFLAVVNNSNSGTYSSLQVFQFNGSSTLTLVGGNATTNAYAYSVSWSADGHFIAVVNLGNVSSNVYGQLQIFQFDGVCTPISITHLDINYLNQYYSVSWSPDNCFIAAINQYFNQLRVYQSTDPSNTSLFANCGTDGSPEAVAWSPDNRYIAVATYAPSIEVFQFNGTTNLTLINSLPVSYGLLSVCWSPDGRFLAAASRNGPWLQIFQFNGSTIKALKTITLSATAYFVSWSPDGRFIAVLTSSVLGLQIYQVNYTVDYTPQALSTSIVFGNSALGSSYDATIDFLSGSNVLLNGQVNFDNVN
jgi:Tol biopolymer transport system component